MLCYPFSSFCPRQELSGLVRTHLWDDSIGAFANVYSANGTFYPRISPTSFYPLLANAASDSQAERIVKEWLLSPKRFCIAPNGDMANNTDDCYWGLPSINAGGRRTTRTLELCCLSFPFFLPGARHMFFFPLTPFPPSFHLSIQPTRRSRRWATGVGTSGAPWRS